MSFETAVLFWGTLVIVALLFTLIAAGETLCSGVGDCIKRGFSYFSKFSLFKMLLFIFYGLLALVLFLYMIGFSLGAGEVETQYYYMQVTLWVMTFAYFVMAISLYYPVYVMFKKHRYFNHDLTKVVIVFLTGIFSLYLHGVINSSLVDITHVNTASFAFLSSISSIFVILLSVIIALFTISFLGTFLFVSKSMFIIVFRVFLVIFAFKNKALTLVKTGRKKVLVRFIVNRSFEKNYLPGVLFMAASYFILVFLTASIFTISDELDSLIKSAVVYTHFTDNLGMCTNPEIVNFDVMFLDQEKVLVYNPYCNVEFWTTKCSL